MCTECGNVRYAVVTYGRVWYSRELYRVGDDGVDSKNVFNVLLRLVRLVTVLVVVDIVQRRGEVRTKDLRRPQRKAKGSYVDLREKTK